MPLEKSSVFDSRLTIAFDPVGSRSEWFPSAIIFGTSMLPFFKPQDEVRLEKSKISDIQLGDVIAFQDRSHLIVHRVVKILGVNGTCAFLTKGDSRLKPDPIVFPNHVVGRVRQVGKHRLNRPVWRILGRVIAWISYWQGVACQHLAEGRLNRIRHRLREKGLFPDFELRPLFELLSNPFAWVTRGMALLQLYRVSETRYKLIRRGIEITTWTPHDVESMTQVWNGAFLSHGTTPERLSKMLCQSSWFDPSGCFMARRGGELLGWAFASLRTEDSPVDRKDRKGFVEVAALTEKGFETGIDQVLIHKSLAWLTKRGARKICLGPQPVPDRVLGTSLTKLMAAFTVFGFHPVGMQFEMTLQREGHHFRTMPRLPKELTIESWQVNDDSTLFHFLKQNGHERFHFMLRRYLNGTRISSKILVAEIENRLVGLIAFLVDSEIQDYNDLNWIWALSEPDLPKGYILLSLVDHAYRGQGIGTVLAKEAFELLFQIGCEKIGMWTQRPRFYERFFGVKRCGSFIALKQT